MTLQNKELNIYETAKKEIILRSKPLRLGIIVTNWCNLDCIMCPDDRKKNTQTLTFPTIMRIESLLPFLEVIHWQGGEFFHLDYMKNIFRFMSKYPHITHEITTNGLLFDEEWVEILLSLRSSVLFSIDSIEKKTYEYIRRRASFSKLIEKLEMIRSLEERHGKKLDRGIIVVVMKSNHRELAGFPEFAKKYGFGAIYFKPVQFIKDEENIFDNMGADIQKCLNESMNHIRCKAVETGLRIICWLPIVGHEQGTCGEVEMRYESDNLFCKYPWKTMWIDASRNGSVHPNCACYHPIGNINNGALSELWNSRMMQEYRKKIADNDLGICAKCFKKK